MGLPCLKPLPLYHPRVPQASDLWRLLDSNFTTFREVYSEHFQAKYGYWRPVVDRSVAAFLKCGDLQEGFARVRCPDCKHEMFVAFSCKQRCTCPSCHQKRTLLTAMHVADEVCFPGPHRQVVLTIPKRLRLHTRFDRRLLGKLCSCAWACIKTETRRLLDRDDITPGMIAGIQTHGELLHWHPHIHALVTCGGFTPDGTFLDLPEFDMDSLLLTWQEAVFELYLDQGKIEPKVVENMRTWKYTGFTADQSMYLPAGDHVGIERLVQYITRCPFSLSRLVKVTDKGQVVYKAEKHACQAFPDHNGDGIAAGPKRNFQVLPALDFIAEFTQHIPAKGSHLIRYYGWYSNKARGMRKKAQAHANDPAAQKETSHTPAPRCSRTWAMLIKRVYEVDPLACPKCGGVMKVISFIEPPQAQVIEKILKHCGLWQKSVSRAPPDIGGLARDLDFTFSGKKSDFSGPDQALDLIYENIDTFLATF
ncbi:transposase [Planctomycetota bacterium]